MLENMEQLYNAVALTFAKYIKDSFATEESLEQLFHTYYPMLEFSRTDHWSGILRKELSRAWFNAGPDIKSEPIGQDVKGVLSHLYKYLDYNLFTQVLLNLQVYAGFGYSVPDAKREIEQMEAKYKGKDLTPFAPKAKMLKIACGETEIAYNQDLSAIRALRIFEQFTPMVSFRVSPMGSTPAFADSRNISMLGIGGDRFLRTMPGLKAYYICWEPGTSGQLTVPEQEPGVFSVPGIDYRFTSKSGGEILNEVLFSRFIAAMVWGVFDVVRQYITVLPRMNSVLVIAGQYCPELQRVFERLRETFPQLQLLEERRV
jgi:hypothetical protein